MFFLPYAGIKLNVISCEFSLFNMIHIEGECMIKLFLKLIPLLEN